MKPRTRSRTAWAALAAMWAALAWPLLAQALGSSAGVTWVEVCTAQGMKTIPVAATTDTGTRPSGLSVHGILDHCPWCLPGSEPALPSASLPSGSGRFAPARMAPGPGVAAPIPPAPFAQPPARGPPDTAA